MNMNTTIITNLFVTLGFIYQFVFFKDIRYLGNKPIEVSEMYHLRITTELINIFYPMKVNVLTSMTVEG